MKIIFNPQAGHGASRRHLDRAKEALYKRSLGVEFLPTEYPGHATEMAAALAGEGLQELVAMGGDGTVSEVANGLAKTDTALGIIAVGTGNDFARSLNLPRNDPERALEVIIKGRRRKVDLGLEGGRYFISILGVGFPVMVARSANQARYIKGSAAFFVGVYRALHKMARCSVHLETEQQQQDLKCTSILIQNTPYTGGGLLIAPGASINDGLLDVVIVGDIGRLDLMVNFPRVYTGSHLSHSKFSRLRCRSIKVTSERPLAKVYDGDISGETPLTATVEAGALTVLA